MIDNYQQLTVPQICAMIDLLYSSMDDYLYVYDFENDYYYISPHAVQKFPLPGNSFHDVVYNHGKFVYPEDVDELQNDLNLILAGKKSQHNLQYRWIDLEGKPIWINCRGIVVFQNDKASYMIGCINEIGARQKADNVSGLLGQSSMQSFLQTFSSISPNGFMLRIGLDDFKEINEKLGFEYGDMILKKTAECISDCMSVGQQVYRIVGDEFVILDYLGGKTKDAIALYKHIRHSIDTFVADNHYEAVFTISAGIIESGIIDDHSYSGVLKYSEFALNEAKRQGKNQYYVFDILEYNKFLKKKELTSILRQAVFDDFKGYEAFFQPIIQPDTNKVCGAEALLRFRTDDNQLLSPAAFIPILEETGLIIPVGSWILDQSLKACKTLRQWIPDFKVNVNISYVQVKKSNIASEILSAIDKYGLPPSSIVVELTESGLLESDSRFIKLWSKLKEYGITIALDDFGTGYSNFHYMYDLRPDIIKIDRSFTAKAYENNYEYKLLKLMRGMVSDLNSSICIEGIENEGEREMIHKFNPEFCQGYYYGRPCSFNKFVDQFVSV